MICTEKMNPKDTLPAKIPLSQEIGILRRLINLTASELDLSAVLKDIVDLVSGITKANSVFIYLFDSSKRNLILRASKIPGDKKIEKIILKIGEGITGWVAKQNQPVSINQKAYEDPRFKGFDILPEDKYEAFLSVPIIYKAKAIGVINIQHKNRTNHPKAMVDLIVMVARQVGGFIENAMLYDDARQKIRQFDSLVKVSASVVSEKYLDEVLNLIVVVTAELLNSKICSIMLLDEKGENLIIKATESLSEYYKKKPPVKVDSSLSGDVIKQKKPLAIEDVRHEKRYVYRELAIAENLTSMLLVPMVVKDKAIGIINVYTKEHHRFTDEEISVLQIIAHQAAISVENTKLMAEATVAREALEARKIVERAKGILMKTQNLSEEEAYRLIHRKSMDTCRSMKEIAEAVILTSEISLPRRKKKS